MTVPVPDPTLVREELARVLDSDAFASAARHSRVLQYLVERTLAGEGDQLKEYVLGTEVFDRDAAYDPRIDSIVRVEVRRLRARLDEYYQTAGATNPLVISIPRGTYVPTFAVRPLPAAKQSPLTDALDSPAPQPAPAEGRAMTRFAMIATAATLSIAVLLGTLLLNGDRSPAAASTMPAVAVLPFQNYSGDPEAERIAARTTDAVTAALARLGTVAVASRTSASHYTGEVRPILAIAQALEVDYVMESSAILTGERVHVSVRMVDGATDRKVWVGEYDLATAEIERAARQIAEEAATGLLTYRARVR